MVPDLVSTLTIDPIDPSLMILLHETLKLLKMRYTFPPLTRKKFSNPFFPCKLQTIFQQFHEWSG